MKGYERKVMLPDRESLTVEFKSEQRRPQSDDEIVDNVVALANTQGGTLYLESKITA